LLTQGYIRIYNHCFLARYTTLCNLQGTVESDYITFFYRATAC